MRSIPPDLQAHLDTGVTTLARCWRVARRDGAVLGFTDHDRPLELDGFACLPDSGLDTTELDSAAGLAPGNAEVAGALSADAITEADLERGLYDGAEVDLYLVDWTHPSQRLHLFRGTIGETARGPAGFTAELRGLAHVLDQPTGRAFLRRCDAELGDARCGVALTETHGTILGIHPDGALETDLTEDGFARGLIRIAGGPPQPIREQSGPRLALWSPPPDPPAPGMAIVVTPGCDKTLETCATRFANAVNFRGFPHIPGDDFANSYPNRGEGNDGSDL